MQQGMLESLSQGRNNNLNLLRFIAASLVIYTHAFGVTGHGAAEPLVQLCGLSLGSWAVDVFFVVSGFLVTKSWYRREDLVGFLYARFMRIFPALWVAVFFCVFLVGPIFTSLPLVEYLSHIDTIKFLLENTTLIIKGVFTTLPGVFEEHPSISVNSPLWTLPFELKMYLLLAAFSVVGLTPHRAFLPPLVLVAFCGFVIAKLNLDSAVVPYEDFFRFLFFFFSGSLFYINRKYILISHVFAASLFLCLVSIFILTSDAEFKRLALALVTPYLVMYLSFSPDGWIRHFNKLGDYSYGIYIYGFPIQQMVYFASGPSSATLNFILSWVLCLAFAGISWHFLEKKALGLKMPNWLAMCGVWVSARIKRT